MPGAIASGLTALTDRLGLHWAAADFKTCPSSGGLMFLELNSNPMLQGFDEVSAGELTRDMINWLVGKDGKPTG